jgi:hypothetical protein
VLRLNDTGLVYQCTIVLCSSCQLPEHSREHYTLLVINNTIIVGHMYAHSTAIIIIIIIIIIN